MLCECAAWASRPRSIDDSSPHERGRERYRRAAATAFATLAAKGVNMLVLLISVPLTVRYLGQERYGLWMTITSTLSVLSFADLGVGNGVGNAVAFAMGRSDYGAVKRSLASGLLILLAVAVILSVVLVVAFPHVPWPKLYNITSKLATSEAGPASLVLAACFLCSMPLGVVQRAQVGLQEGARYSVWLGAGSLLSLVGLVAATRLHVGLPGLVMAVAGVPVILQAVNFLHYFGFVKPELRPLYSDVDYRIAASLLRVGVGFFVLQLAYVVTTSGDFLIASHILGVASVTQLSIAQRGFFVGPMLAAMLTGPLWAAYGEAMTRGDKRWIAVTLRRSVVTSSVVSAGISATLLAFSEPIFHRWVGAAHVPAPSLCIPLVLSGIVGSATGAGIMLLLGTGMIWEQLPFSIAAMLLGILAKIVLCRAFGLNGLAWATVLVGLAITTPSVLFLVKRCLWRDAT